VKLNNYADIREEWWGQQTFLASLGGK